MVKRFLLYRIHVHIKISDSALKTIDTTTKQTLYAYDLEKAESDFSVINQA